MLTCYSAMYARPWFFFLFLFLSLGTANDNTTGCKNINMFFQLRNSKKVQPSETDCVDSGDPHSSSSTEKPTTNVPNYTFKANNVEFNPLTSLWQQCGALLTAALPQSSCIQPQEYSKLVEITFCLAPPSINPCVSSSLMLTNNASVVWCCVNSCACWCWLKMTRENDFNNTWQFIWTSPVLENYSISKYMHTCKYEH